MSKLSNGEVMLSGMATNPAKRPDNAFDKEQAEEAASQVEVTETDED